MKYTIVNISEILKHPTMRLDAAYWVNKKKKENKKWIEKKKNYGNNK